MSTLDYERRRRAVREALDEEGALSISEIARRKDRHRVYVSRVVNGRETSEPVLREVEEALAAERAAQTPEAA